MSEEKPIIKIMNGNYIVKFMGVTIEYTSNTLSETLRFLKKRYPNAVLERKEK